MNRCPKCGGEMVEGNELGHLFERCAKCGHRRWIGRAGGAYEALSVDQGAKTVTKVSQKSVSQNVTSHLWRW